MRVAGVILAAGRAARFGGALPKPLADFRGEALVHRAARVALEAELAPVLVVVGCAATAVAAAVADLTVVVVDNPDWAEGKASSVRAAVAALPATVDAALFLPCDQPLLDAATLHRLVRAYALGAPVVVPAHAGRRGAPVLFTRELWSALAGLRGEAGGRDLLAGLGGRVVEVELPGGEPLLDVDTVEELERLGAGEG